MKDLDARKKSSAHPLGGWTPARLPTVRQLRYFVALEQEGHFGRAAADCHVSQSAFSVAIRDLETLLGVSLVDRSNRSVTITPTGREVAAQARLCLRDLGQIAELAARRQGPMTGPLTLGVIPTLAPFLLPKCLPKLRRHFPDLRLFIREEQTAQLVAALESGELDLALLALPYALPHVTVMPLFQDRFLLAGRADTKLVDPEHFAVNRVTAGSILLLQEGHCMRDQAMAACRVRSMEAVNAFAASSLLTLLAMVDGDLGVTFLPEMAVGSALLKQTRIRTWPLKHGGHREIALIWRHNSARDAEFRDFGAQIRTLAAPTPEG
jgi:LysR family hydrogen peroxide-inducible transcriptional activator